MGNIEVLNDNIVKAIKSIKLKQWEDENLNALFPNVILRSDVLQILDNYCTVVYYPLQNEGNNGFHISNIPDIKEVFQHFVYINTAQSLEKQVFTAAHELGHAWNIDEQVLREFDKEFIDRIRRDGDSARLDDLEERIVNRFAAELLMPENEFRAQYENELNKTEKKPDGVQLSRFLRIVAFLMNFFLVPMKAVLIRMAELNILKVDTVNVLTNDNETPLTVLVNKEIDKITKEEGYTDLYKITEKKYIDGLVEILEKAEKKQSVSAEKIKRIRERFELKPEINVPELSKPIELG